MKRRDFLFASLGLSAIGALALYTRGMMGNHQMMGAMMQNHQMMMPSMANKNSNSYKKVNIKGWNNKAKIAQGKRLYLKNCASCHGLNAQGAFGPALNGYGHVSHHSPSKLLAQINNGGGGMPPFKGKLSQKEQESILIYLHSKWPKKVKEKYDKKFNIKG